MINSSDKFLIEKLIEIRNRGMFANGRECTDVYNRVFDAHLAPTSCGSCIRTRINLLERELRRQEAEEAKALEEQMKEAQVAENNEGKKEEEQENGHVRKGSTRKKRNSQTAAD